MVRNDKRMAVWELVEKMDDGEINFDTAWQRSLVWDIARKSLLIHSILYGYAISPLYFAEGADGEQYDSLDGKQRSNTICSFIKGEFALKNVPPFDIPRKYDHDDEGVLVLEGKKFDDLPEWAQKVIKQYQIDVVVYKRITDTEIREFFSRLNYGKTMTATEITRVKTPCLEKFQELAHMEAVQMVMTETARKSFVDENLVMQIYQCVTKDENDFSSKVFREWVQGLEVLDNDSVSLIHDALEVFGILYKRFKNIHEMMRGKDAAAKKLVTMLKKRIHFVSSVYAITLILKKRGWTDTLTQEEIRDAADIADKFLRSFFRLETNNGYASYSDDYNNTVTSGSAKAEAVTKRKAAINSAVTDFIQRNAESFPVNQQTNDAEDTDGDSVNVNNETEDIDISIVEKFENLAKKAARFIFRGIFKEDFEGFETETEIREYIWECVQKCCKNYVCRSDTTKAILIDSNEMPYKEFENKVVLYIYDLEEQATAEKAESQAEQAEEQKADSKAEEPEAEDPTENDQAGGDDNLGPEIFSNPDDESELPY